MPKKFYGAGYSGHTPEQLLRVAQVLNATVIDIRMSAGSKNPAWGKWNLAKVLSGRYVHIPQLGNVNYKTPDTLIEIKDMDAGLALVGMDRRDVVILLCGCRDSEWCHRTVVLDEIANRADEANLAEYDEMEFQELDWTVANDHPQTAMDLDQPGKAYPQDGEEWDNLTKRIPNGGFSFLRNRFPDTDQPKDLYFRDVPPPDPDTELVFIDMTPAGDTQTRLVVIEEVYRAGPDSPPADLKWLILRPATDDKKADDE